MNAHRLIVIAAVFGSATARAAQGGFLGNFSVLGEPLDLVISDDNSRAILRTGQFNPPAPYDGRVYVFDLETNPPTLLFTHVSDCDATAQDYVATLGNYCITLAGGANSTEVFTLDPPALTTTIPGRHVDVVAAEDSLTGHELGIVKGSQGPILVLDLTTGLGINGSLVPEFGVPGTPDFGSSLAMSDSVQATGKRAIGIANRPGNELDGFVGITDFAQPATVATTQGTS
jgi:hypothetical protein